MSRRGENIYKRKDGRWEGRILKPDGKYRYVYGKNYHEVREKKKNLIQGEILRQNNDMEIKMDATSLFKNWIIDQSIGCIRRSTYDSYYCCINKYIIPFFQSNENRITQHSVEKFVQALVLKQELSSSYRKKILSIFKTALKDITKKYGLILPDVDLSHLPKKANIPIEVFTANEQIRIEQAIIESNDFRAYGILLCFYTGIRLGELCALRWENIDLEAGVMSIIATAARVNRYDNQGCKTVMVTGTPKSRCSGRIIPLPIFLINLLKSHAPDEENMNNYVFSFSDKPVEPRTMQRIYHKLLKSANVSKRKFHTTRHTFATRALELSIDIKTLSEILGHSSVSITLNIYAHSMLEQKKIAIEKMNSMYLAHPITVFMPSNKPSIDI